MVISSPGLRPYIEAKLGVKLSPAAQFIGSLRQDNSIWGVVAYDTFSNYDCEIFMAGDPGWTNKTLLRAAFDYPFRQLKLARVTGRVDAADERTLNIDLKLGFKVEGRLRNALGDRDIIIVGLLRQECRWIGNGKEKRA